MTSTQSGRAVGEELADRPAPEAADVRVPDVTWLDLLGGGAVLGVALLAWASLALAHIGAHSLPAVAVLTAGACGLVVLLCRRLSRGRIRVGADGAGVLIALAAAGVAATLAFPGFSYGVADKDPGGYVSHAVEIARSGDFAFTDRLLHDHLPVQLASPNARFAGVWVRNAHTGQMVPQFYHLWPALLATAYDVDGYAGIRFVVPLMGVVAALAMVALLRRVGAAVAGPTAGLVAALAGGLLLATNMLEVWQSRFPTTEVLTEALYLGALLGIVVALQTGWRPAAALAGLLVGVGWLNRADGLLLVLMAVGVGAVLISVRRWDARASWFAIGLGVVLPHDALQAFDLARNYTEANGVPSPLANVALVGAVLILALLLRRFAQRPLARAAAGLQHPRPQALIGVTVCAVAIALLVVGFLRPRLFGEQYFSYNGARTRSYDEEILLRLSWFFTLPGFVLMYLGLVAVALRRWRASAWVAVLPTLVLFPLYAYAARNSTRMLWWTRRYVTTVMPGIVVLIALAVGVAFVLRLRGRPLLRVPALGALAGLVAAFMSQSLPLRGHDEWRGALQVTRSLADLSAGTTGLYLWEPQEVCCASPTQLFATPLWLAYGELSVLLPFPPSERAQTIATYVKHFPGKPMFVVGDRRDPPVGVDPATVQPVMTRHVDLPMWDESDTYRPTHAHVVGVDFTVWRVRGT